MSAARIVIIDDEPGICWAIEKALGEDGYEVATAADGAEGLELLDSKGASLVLLDYKNARHERPGSAGTDQGTIPGFAGHLHDRSQQHPHCPGRPQEGRRCLCYKTFSPLGPEGYLNKSPCQGLDIQKGLTGSPGCSAAA